MQIKAEYLDSHVVQALMTGLTASFSNPHPTTEERRIQVDERDRFKPDFRPLGKWLGGGVLLATVGAISVFTFGLETATAIGTAIGLWNGIFWGSFAAGMVQSFRAATSAARLVHSDLLAKWIPHIDLSRSERAYCETVAILARPETHIGDETGRHILLDLNALIQQARHLDAQRTEIERISTAESIAAL